MEKSKELFEENLRNWKQDFHKAFDNSFKDSDLCESCINWIDNLLLEKDCYLRILLKELVSDVNQHITKEFKNHTERGKENRG